MGSWRILQAVLVMILIMFINTVIAKLLCCPIYEAGFISLITLAFIIVLIEPSKVEDVVEFFRSIKEFVRNI